MLRPLSVLIGLVVLLPAARADVVVTTLQNKAPIHGISVTADDGSVVLTTAQGTVTKLDTRDVVDVSVLPAPAPPAESTQPFEVEMTDGTLLRGTPEKGTAGSLKLKSLVLGGTNKAIELSLDNVRTLRRIAGKAVPGASRLVRLPDKDAAYRLSGARIEGYLAQVTDKGVVMDRHPLESRTIPYDDLAAVFLVNPPLHPAEGLHAIARLSDGSTLVLAKGFRVSAGLLTGNTRGGLRIAVPFGAVASLGFEGGGFVHLSALKPEKIERTPFFPLPKGTDDVALLDFVCPVRFDKSPDGNPIRLRGTTYRRGIGVRPKTVLTYALGDRYKTFRAICGIDDEISGPQYGHGAGSGSVVFEVYVDGKKAFDSGLVTGNSQPVAVDVDITGKKTLTLAVTFVPNKLLPGGRSDTPELDDAVWARPLLIR